MTLRKFLCVLVSPLLLSVSFLEEISRDSDVPNRCSFVFWLVSLWKCRAFNAQRAKNQNITVGVSFGATRELAFLLATEGGKNDVSHNDSCRLYFPQPNNGVFSFGRDVNIRWKHGINALPEDEQDGKGRVSIILWGLCENVIDESGSPPMLGADGKGPHAQRHHHHQRGGKSYNNKNSSNDNRRTHHHNHQQQNKQNSNENNQRNGAGGGR